jgi:hypothetical protein
MSVYTGNNRIRERTAEEVSAANSRFGGSYAPFVVERELQAEDGPCWISWGGYRSAEKANKALSRLNRKTNQGEAP